MFPVENGQFRIYQVTQVINNGFGLPIDSASYQRKDLVTEPFIALNGDSVFLLKRFIRNNANTMWQLDSVWTIRRNISQGVITENNIPFLKLVFPVEEGKTWDGNALNAKECPDDPEYFCDLYEMISLRSDFQYDSLTFLNTVTVNQQESFDKTATTTDNVRKEVYASGIGLVYKQIYSVSYLQCNNGQNAQCCCADPNQFCTLCAGIVDRGFRFTEVLIDHGFE